MPWKNQLTNKCIVYVVLQSLVLHLSRMHNIGNEVAEKKHQEVGENENPKTETTLVHHSS